ncbi:MAG: molybdopterin synthase sulfur carrier subunit [Anaerolineae bacterium]|nr:molybdopterin synthase sulfur carrier subunit [Anaerolineae bacterium]
MAYIKIPTPLRQYTGNQAEVAIRGATVDEALRDLVARYPALAPHLYEGDDLRSFVNIFLGDEDIRFLQDLATPLTEDARLRIIPAIAGGTSS